MTFKEIIKTADEIVSGIIKDPEQGFINFRIKWLNLEPDDRRLIAPTLINFCSLKIEHDNGIPQAENIAEQKICCTGIINFISDEFNGRPWFGTLSAGEGVDEVDIATVFKLLVDIGYIKNTLDQTARVMTRIFGYKQDFERYSYYNDDTKLITSASEFKNKIFNSKLLRGRNK